MDRITLLYDAHCPLCRNLAGFVKTRGAGKVTIASWQAFAQKYNLEGMSASHPESIGVWTGTELHVAEKAWELLLNKLPDLQAVNWLAAKLGLSKTLARVLEATGHAARRLCISCPPEERRARRRAGSRER